MTCKKMINKRPSLKNNCNVKPWPLVVDFCPRNNLKASNSDFWEEGEHADH